VARGGTDTIAHEFGHHIQNLTGVMDKVQRAGQNNRLNPSSLTQNRNTQNFSKLLPPNPVVCWGRLQLKIKNKGSKQ
jgi:hypothetical protein